MLFNCGSITFGMGKYSNQRIIKFEDAFFVLKGQFNLAQRQRLGLKKVVEKETVRERFKFNAKSIYRTEYTIHYE
jgi:hypothetical protein